MQTNVQISFTLKQCFLYYSNAVHTVRLCKRVRGGDVTSEGRLFVAIVCLVLSEKREISAYLKGSKVRTFTLDLP